MCGIVGTLNLTRHAPIEERALRQMLSLIRHRGPDEFGLYRDADAGLGSARLSIIDLSGGQQPITNEDGTLWIVFNGEIFNYRELKPALEARGHRLATQTDTEIILHLYEEHGAACLDALNGQFAFAIWDARRKTLLLARDRLGIRPLFYTIAGGRLLFASEIKALLADEAVGARFDPLALAEVFTYWSTLTPHTVFEGIHELPPGHFMRVQDGAPIVQHYWTLDFPPAEDVAPGGALSQDDYADALRALLVDATRIRLRADVPVGAYLSGGLDSSLIAAIVRRETQTPLDTFSLAFDNPAFDESAYQRQMAAALGTAHQVVSVADADVGAAFPDVIWHAETPILRTSPAPMFLLSERVRAHDYKVVLTGEGADELFAGYNIFKEAKIRRFWAREPESTARAALVQRLYPYIAQNPRSRAFLTAFFRQGLADTAAPGYSHALRWRNTGRIQRLFSDALRDTLQASGANGHGPAYPAAFATWHPQHQAQYLELTIFMAQYLLSSQGDRMGMAHAVEGRFPFLDHRVVEFATHLPPRYSLRGLTEKYLLRQVARGWLPETIWERPKRPYRAPIHRSFFGPGAPEYVQALLAPESIRQAGVFDPAAVGRLAHKIAAGGPVSETDDMALAGILSTQLVHHHFMAHFTAPPPLSDADDVKVCTGPGVRSGAHQGVKA